MTIRQLAIAAATAVVCATMAAAAAWPQAVAYSNLTPGIMGGVWNDQVMGALEGRWTTPLDDDHGAQVDGILGTIGGSTYGQIAGHAFWRDPAKQLIGIYGAWNTWYGASAWRLGPEFEFYKDDNTLTGVGGVRWSEGSSTGLFLQVKGQHYSDPNTKEFIGYIYEGASFVNAGFEHQFEHDGEHNGWTAQGEVRLGSGVFGAWLGLRKYFGDGTADQDKSLLARDRGDVAPIWLHLPGDTEPALPPCPDGYGRLPGSGDGCFPLDG